MTKIINTLLEILFFARALCAIRGAVRDASKLSEPCLSWRFYQNGPARVA